MRIKIETNLSVHPYPRPPGQCLRRAPYVLYILDVCFICFIWILHEFYLNVVKVDLVCRAPYISYISNVCFIWTLYVFYLNVTKVNLVLHMLQ